MKLNTSCLFIVLVTCSALNVTLVTSKPNREKRSIFNFMGMLYEVMGFFELLKLSTYGNYCGIGGSGKVLSALDECCKNHDECWNNVTETCDESGYTFSYSYKIQQENITCLEGTPCEVQLCKCDKTAATCFRKNRKYLHL